MAAQTLKTNISKVQHIKHYLHGSMVNWALKFAWHKEEDVNLLFQLTVDGQDLRVADKGKGQDGHSVCSLKDRQIEERKIWL